VHFERSRNAWINSNILESVCLHETEKFLLKSAKKDLLLKFELYIQAKFYYPTLLSKFACNTSSILQKMDAGIIKIGKGTIEAIKCL